MLGRNRQQAVIQGLIPRLVRLPKESTVLRWVHLAGGPFPLLFLLLVGLYLATSSGHVTSGDEDQTYLMIEALVERHSLAFTTFHQPVESYGIVQPLLALPFYLLGKLLALAAPPEYSAVIGRFAVTGLNAFLTAATATLLALVARELGASTRPAVGLSLTFAVGTIAWPYARSFWAEPVGALALTGAVWCAVRSRRRDPLVWWTAVGVLIGVCAATRVGWAVALPAFVAYLGIVAFGNRRRVPPPFAGGEGKWRRPWLALFAGDGEWWWLRRAALGLGLGVFGPAALVLAINALRHGHPLDFGFGLARNPGAVVASLLDPARLVTGAFGLLLSSGKGVFFYSPVLLGAALGLPAFSRRHPAEAILAVGVVASFIATYGSYGFWPGNPGWGPRYLVPVVPFVLLCLLAWLDPRPARDLSSQGPAPVLRQSLGRWALVSLLGVSVSVQLFTLTTPFQAYLSATAWAWAGYDRAFDTDSPILGQARIFAQRLHQYGPFPMPTPPHPVRGAAGDLILSNGVQFATAENGSAAFWLVFDQSEADPRTLALRLDDRPMDPSNWRIVADEARWQVLGPIGNLEAGLHHLDIRASPAEPVENRNASTSLLADDLAIYQDGLPFSLKQWPDIHPIPVSVEEPWSRAAYGWFNDGRKPQLLDLWPWYVAHSGLPPWLAGTALIPMAVVVVAGRQLYRLVGRPSDVRVGGAVVGLASIWFLAIMAWAVLVPGTAVQPWYVAEPQAASDTWQLQGNEARLLPLPGGERLRLRLDYVDDDASPLVVHFQPGVDRPWQYARWVLPRNGSREWKSTELLVPPGDTRREVAFTSTTSAVLRPVVIETANDPVAPPSAIIPAETQ